jgi:DNA polymerase-1
MANQKLFLLDAYALIYRAYYAFIKTPRINSRGQNTSAILGFVNTLQEVLTKEQPTHIAVCFDPPGGTFRHEAFADYKAQREKQPEDITMAVPYVKRLLEAYRIPVIEVSGYEADDVIGTFARLAEERGDFDTYMMTPDKDYAQLVAERTFIFRPKSFGPGFEVLGVPQVLEKYQLQRVDQVIDLLGLMGDTADNIPGCPGVGLKTAQKLIADFGSIEQLLQHTDQLKGALQRKVVENAEQIRQSHYLATICRDVPVTFDPEQLCRREPDAAALMQLFEELEFRRLAEKLMGDGKPAEVPADTRREKSAKRAAARTAANDGMGSLFDAPAEESVADASTDVTVGEEHSAPMVQSSLTSLEQVETHYTLCDTAELRAQLVQQLFFNERWAFKVLADGVEPMNARLLGVAFATEHHRAWYVPVEDSDALEDLRPLFENEGVEKIAHNVKIDYILLHRYGIELSAPMFDPMVAHYLLQPEMRHDLASLAEMLLHYRLQSLSVAPDLQEQLAVACEAADVAGLLAEPLRRDLKQYGHTQLFYDIEMPLVAVLGDMEYTGVRLDVTALKESETVLNEELKKIEQELVTLAGHPFNPLSPRAVGEVLFDELQLDPKAKKTRTGQYVTSEEVLQKLRDRSPIVEMILNYRGVRKLLSTYVETLPTMINPRTGRIHASFNQTVTVTGRLSSSNPNLQNIPIRDEMGRELRKAFIPDDGCIFFSADYSQIELRLMAHLSQDPAMIDAFLHDGDIHTATAAKIYHVAPDEVTKAQRTKAKTANFGIIYGISVFGLASRLNIPRAEAKELIDGYFATYPKIHEFMEQSIESARQKGYVETLFGRRRALPDIHSANATVRGYAERNAINAPIQGTAADIIKIAMVRIARRLRSEHLHARLLVQVHDELNFSVPVEELEALRSIVIEEMQGACTLSVPLIADCGEGANWLEAH